MTEIRCRMIAAQYGLHASGKAYEDDYSESLSYDANSNIKSIVRMGYVDENDTHFGEVDHLLISHNGNKLAHVESQGNPWALTPHFTKTKDETEEYRFNANGALTIDRNRGIVSIQYDNLGHPCQVLFRDGSYTQYVYAADGTKLRVTHGKAVPGQTLAWGETKMLTADKIQSVNTTDYWGNVLYENSRPTTVLSNGRYVLLNQDSTLTWCSVEKDHLGSNRVVRETTPGINRLQINHYYPFGNTFGEYNHCDENTDLQRYKFNGKELDLVHGMRLYDYGARMYDQILGCWTSVDPMAEKYYHISPYVFCENDPVNKIDMHGDSIVVLHLLGNIGHLGLLVQNESGKWQYFSMNGTWVYKGTFGLAGGKPYHDLGEKTFNSPQDFLNSSYNRNGTNDEIAKNAVDGYGYEEGYMLPTTPKQDATIRKTFKKLSKKGYSLITNQCAQVVRKSLESANIITKLIESVWHEPGGYVNIFSEPQMPQMVFQGVRNNYPNGILLKRTMR